MSWELNRERFTQYRPSCVECGDPIFDSETHCLSCLLRDVPIVRAREQQAECPSCGLLNDHRFPCR